MKTYFTPRKTSFATQRGFTMIDLLLTLLVVVVLIGIAIYGYGQTTGSSRRMKAQNEILFTIGSAKSLYGNADQYGSVTTAIAVQGGVTGSMRLQGGNTAQNAYDGAVTFTAATLTVANDALNMGYANVLREDCQANVMAGKDLARQIQVAGVDVKPADGVVNVATLSTQCNSAARVTINYIFGRN